MATANGRKGISIPSHPDLWGCVGGMPASSVLGSCLELLHSGQVAARLQGSKVHPLFTKKGDTGPEGPERKAGVGSGSTQERKETPHLCFDGGGVCGDSGSTALLSSRGGLNGRKND